MQLVICETTLKWQSRLRVTSLSNRLMTARCTLQFKMTANHSQRLHSVLGPIPTRNEKHVEQCSLHEEYNVKLAVDLRLWPFKRTTKKLWGGRISFYRLKRHVKKNPKARLGKCRTRFSESIVMAGNPTRTVCTCSTTIIIWNEYWCMIVNASC